MTKLSYDDWRQGVALCLRQEGCSVLRIARRLEIPRKEAAGVLNEAVVNPRPTVERWQATGRGGSMRDRGGCRG